MGPPQTRGEKRVRVDVGQVETPAAYRCNMGWPKVARRAWRLQVRGGPLDLIEITVEIRGMPLISHAIQVLVIT